MAYKIEVTDKHYIHYLCSDCHAEVGFSDPRCPATGCGHVFVKGDVRKMAKPKPKPKPKPRPRPY